MSTKKPIVTVVGLGTVGLPSAIVISSSRKYRVYGLDISQKRLADIKSGQAIIRDSYARSRFSGTIIDFTSDPAMCLPVSSYIVICVPTPINRWRTPDLTILKSALKTVQKFLKPRQNIIIESTIYPGVCEKEIKPLLEKTGLSCGRDFHISHCPERINPGDKKWNISNIPRNVGSLDRLGLKKSAEFYRSILRAKVYEFPDIKAVELSKIIENTFRDINIAFVNELALFCYKAGFPVTQALAAAGTKPFSFLKHTPGLGVGGDCIPIDPHYLFFVTDKFKTENDLSKTARKVNNRMPKNWARIITDILNKHKVSKVGVVGLTYKEEVSSVDLSPARELCRELKNSDLDVYTYDPYRPDLSTENSLQELAEKSEALILTVRHKKILDQLAKLKAADFGIKCFINATPAKVKIDKIEHYLLF